LHNARKYAKMLVNGFQFCSRRYAVRKFLIREAHLYEIEDIKAFYRRNPDPHVMLRNDSAIEEAINEGVFLIALDLSKEEGDRIFAASAVYTVRCAEADGTSLVLKEAGGSNVHLDYRGFGVHKIFHCIRGLHEHFLDTGGFSTYFGAIITPNNPSEKNIRRMGFEVWENPPGSLVEIRNAYCDNGQKINFYKLPAASLPTMARTLIADSVRGSLTKSSNGDYETVELELRVELFKRYKSLLEKVASNDLSSLINQEK
jgi:hypothetical protein